MIVIKRWLAIVMALLIMVGSLPQMAMAASPLDSWTVRGPLPTGENLIDVAYGNGTYVAVGNNGVVMTSLDGASWTNQTSGITSNLKDVSYINDQFVAVGQGGKIILSDDGASWTSATNNDTSELTSVAYGNGMYVAVGGFGKVLTSGDGANWTVNPNSPVIGNSVLYAITFGNGVFVVAGNNGSDGTIYTSSDGTSWTSQSSNVYVSLLDAVYGLDKYVVVGTEGKIVTSEDGVTWTQRTSGTQENLLSVTYGNGKYVATANSGVIRSSTDGVTWSNETSGVNSGSLMGVAYGPGTYVVVGTGGTILTGTDEGAWTIRSPLPTSSGLNGIAYGNGTYVAVGSGGTVATSGDGITWSNRTKSSMTQYLSGVAFGKGVFVAADANGTMHASADGITWSNNWGGVSTQFNGVAYGNGLFIAVGANGWISTSEDGTSWTGWRSNTTQALSGVSYGKGKYVAVGDAGTVVVSSDGMNWTSQTSGTTKQLKGIAYGNSTFVAAGADGTLIVSTDGVNWTSAVSNSTASLNGIAYRNHTFVAVGAAGVILTSNDGTSWIQSTNPDTLKYNAVAYSNGEYVAVGESGRVLQSGTSTILPEVSGVDISPRSVSLVQGGSQQLTASVEAAGGAATTVTWTSSDTSGGVTVDAAGNVTVAATATLGYHTITATSTEDGGQLGTSTITVTAAPGAPAVSSVSIAPSYSSVQQGKSQQLTATVSVEHGAATTVHWSSSDISGKVAVDATGKVTVAPTAVPGSYTIRATSTVDNSKIGTATITVTVVPVTWTSRGSSSVTSTNLNGLTYGSGKYVAVGNSGTVVTSEDGVTWTRRTVSGVTQNLQSVIHENGKYVAVGQNSTIITSDDGLTWTKRTVSGSQNLQSVTYGNGKFVAVGANGRVITSPDGTSWTVQTSNVTYNLNGVTYGNGQYVAVGYVGTVITSANAITWTAQTINSYSDIYSIAYENGKYIAGGSYGALISSPDGVSWASHTSNASYHLNGIAYGNDMYVVVGNSGKVVTSADGVNWTLQSSSSSTTNNLLKVIYVNDTFMAVGVNGTILQSVPDPAVNSVSVSPSSVSVERGRSQQLTATVDVVGNAATTVTWTSSDTDGLVTVDAAGNVTVAANAELGPYTIQATSTADATKIGTATITVIVRTQTDEEAVADDKAALELGFGNGDSDTNVTQDLTLPTSGASGTAINWSSDEVSVIADNGQVTRPSAAAGDQLVTLTATITKGSVTDTRTFTVTVKAAPKTDAEAVADDKASLEVGFGTGDSDTNVTQDLTLPPTGANGTTITWSSSAPGVIADNGQVTRPSAAAGDQFVTLTATITKGSVTDTQTFDVTVKAAPQTDAEAVADDKALLEVGFGNGDSDTNVTQDLTLPASGANGTTITWSSNTPNVIADNGQVTRPSATTGDQFVTLTATITKGSVTDTQTFDVTVKAAPQTDAEAVADDKASLEVGFGTGDSDSNVTQDLTLPATGVNGTTITWSSNVPSVVADNGQVTRPSAAAGDQLITLTATITKGSATDTRTFTVTVKAAPQTDAEAVAEDKSALAISFGGSDIATNVTQDLILPASGANGTTITWSSNVQSVIADNGQVTRPSAAAGDQFVILTATITKGSVTDTQTFDVTVKAAPQTDAEAVADDKAALAIGFGGNDIATNVTQDLTLPASGANGTTITWSSNVPSFIADNGQVTRPSAATGDQFVTLTATITKGSVTDTQTFDVTVKAAPQTDAEAVADDKAALAISFGGNDIATNVTQDLTLPAGGANGTTITWSSSASGVIADNGQVTRPTAAAGDQLITLTATITKGSITDTQTFNVTVKAAPQTDAEAVADDKAALAISFGGSDIATNVTQSLTLPATGANGTTITWSSNMPNVIANNGQVTRPSAAAGDQSVILTATITKGSATDTRTFTITVKALPAPPVVYYPAPTPTTNAGQANEATVIVLVNGKEEQAGVAAASKRNEQTVLTIAVDEKKLGDKLTAEGQGAIITIPVNTQSDVVIGELNGQMVKNMENQKAVVEIKIDRATYKLPAQQVNIDAISEQIGKTVALEDIKIQVEIAAPTSDTVKVVENAAVKGTFTLVAAPIEFSIRAIYESKTIEVSQFNAYVERTIAIPAGIDPNKITTGIVVEADGTTHHVPTKIIKVDDQYYAQISSLTNSTYAIVWHPLEFLDVANHWSQKAVNDMGARMVIEGTGDGLFSPDRDITRAEFATILVRALGLKLAEGSTAFADVNTSDWYSRAIETAYTYQLVQGYEDGTFRPQDKITREQAMTMLSRAMAMTGLKAQLSEPGGDTLLDAFEDVLDVSDWAGRSVADSVQAGLVTGRSAAELAPKAFITRAEVATIMQRLLQKSDLI